MTEQAALAPPDPNARRVTVSEMLSAAAEIVQAHPAPSEAPSVPETRKRKPPKKTIVTSNLKELKMEEAAKIEWHITKYPTAIIIQNMEGLTVNLEERQLHLNSHSLGCTRKDAKMEKMNLIHMYNAASPEMPEPKEKKFEAEYIESIQPENKTSFDELSFMEKSKCWSSQFSCQIRITDGISLERLLKKLAKIRLTRSDYQTVVDSQFLASTLEL